MRAHAWPAVNWPDFRPAVIAGLESDPLQHRKSSSGKQYPKQAWTQASQDPSKVVPIELPDIVKTEDGVTGHTGHIRPNCALRWVFNPGQALSAKAAWTLICSKTSSSISFAKFSAFMNMALALGLADRENERASRIIVSMRS